MRSRKQPAYAVGLVTELPQTVDSEVLILTGLRMKASLCIHCYFFQLTPKSSGDHTTARGKGKNYKFVRKVLE